MTDVLIVSTPFVYCFGPSLAPALLKSCCEVQGVNAKAWDIAGEFYNKYEDHPNFNSIRAWMETPDIKLTKQEFDWYQDIVKDYAEKIVVQNPRWLAVSLLTYNSLRFSEDLCYFVKLLNPAIKIALGGSGQRVNQYYYKKSWNSLMIDSGLAECAVVGEGEFVIADIVKNNLSGVITVPQLTNTEFEKVPVPNYDDYDLGAYRKVKKSFWAFGHYISDIDSGIIFNITGSKGCVMSCSFCDIAVAWPKFRFRSGESIAEEMIELHKKYDARLFSFTDSLLNGGLKPFYQMNKVLSERLPYTVGYEGQMIIRSRRDMPEHHFNEMAAAGCYAVSIGIESGSDRVREHMRKGSTAEDINYTTRMLLKHQIKQAWNIFAGYPNETEQDWQQTLDLVRYWITESQGLIRINPSVSVFNMYNDTPILDGELGQSMGVEQVATPAGLSPQFWTSPSYPENTFDVRVRRYLELADFLMSTDDYYRTALAKTLSVLHAQLDLYNREYKQPKKVFSIVAA